MIFECSNDILFSPDQRIVINTTKCSPKTYEKKIQYIISTLNLESYTKIEDELLDFNKTYPTSGGVILTNQCQLKCKYCYYESGEKDNTSLTKKNIDTIISYFIKNGKIRRLVSNSDFKIGIQLSGGGEPTCRWDLFKYFVDKFKSECTRHGFDYYIELSTNGILSDEQIDYIAENIDSITVSFDGLKEIQNEQRPFSSGSKNSFDIVQNTISQLDKKEGIKYAIRTTLLNKYVNRMQEIAEYIYTNFNNFNVWTVEEVNYIGRAKNDYKENRISYLNNYIKTKEWTLKNYRYKGRMLSDKLLTQPIRCYCSTSLGLNPWFDAYGDIVPCVENKKEKILYGKLINDQIKLFENSDEYHKKQRDIVRKNCSSCYAYLYCDGGCPINMYRNEDGTFLHIYGQDICNMIRLFWKTALNNLANGKRFLDIIPTEKIKLDYCEDIEIYRFDYL